MTSPRGEVKRVWPCKHIHYDGLDLNWLFTMDAYPSNHVFRVPDWQVCPVCEAKRPAPQKRRKQEMISKDEAYTILHRLWGVGHDAPGYVKSDWSDLANYIAKLEANIAKIEDRKKDRRSP